MTSGDDPIAAKLAEDFPGYYFWRARNSAGDPMSWMATRTDKRAGIDPTLMARDVPALRALLANQRDAAENGGTLPTVSTTPDAFWNSARP